jgi:hypothetical protein
MSLGNPASASTVYTTWLGAGGTGAPVANTSFTCAIADYISPGSTANSAVYQKLSGGCTPQMPLGGTPFTAAQLAEFANWINSGAPNN